MALIKFYTLEILINLAATFTESAGEGTNENKFSKSGYHYHLPHVAFLVMKSQTNSSCSWEQRVDKQTRLSNHCCSVIVNSVSRFLFNCKLSVCVIKFQSI